MGVLITTIVALLISFFASSSILNMVLYAWSGLGSAFGPLVLASLYYKKANRYGAIAGILMGGLTAGFWPLINLNLFTIIVPSMIPGFFMGCLSIFIISELTNNK